MATQNNKRILHRKEWQRMNKAPVSSVAGSFIIKDPLGIKRTSLFISSATVHHLYAADEDAWMQIPSLALAGTFGAGSCGAWGGFSNAITANGGTTNTLTTLAAINSSPYGEKVRFLTGSNAGQEVTVTGVKILPGGTNTLIFTPALPNAVANNDTFAVSTGKYFVLNAGTVAANIFKSVDPLTGIITTLGVTGLPATIGTDGRLVATPSYVGSYATGTATSATSTTISNITKTWAVNQWCNYQVRITAGTGIGQVRTITSNTATQLTVPTWTITPDATSVYAIEANDDFLYLIGNNAVTMYRYSISASTWTTLAPTTARTGAPTTGIGANWIGKSGNPTWQDESNIADGRYIFSFRGGATNLLDRYDISGGTAGAGAWLAVTYTGQLETFTTGSSYDYSGGKLFIRKENTGRFFYYDVIGNYIYPFTVDDFPDGAAVIGDKLFTVSYDDGSGDSIEWLYYMLNTSNELRRIMIY